MTAGIAASDLGSAIASAFPESDTERWLATLAAIAGILVFVWAVLFGSRTIFQVARKLRRRVQKRTIGTRVAGSGRAFTESPASADDDLSQYLEKLRRTHERLRFGDPTALTLGQDDIDPVGRMNLRQVYTPLSVATEFSPSVPNVRSQRSPLSREPILDALKRPECHRVVVLGDPGSGKSTLVNYLAAQLAAQRLTRESGEPQGSGSAAIPVHIRLSEVDASKEDLLEALFSGVREVSPSESPSPLSLLLIEALKLGNATLFFDGLDEVKRDSLTRVRVMIEEAANRFPNSQVVVTCRTYDYSLSTPRRSLPFTVIHLLPFTADDMQTFVRRWYTELGRVKAFPDVESRCRNLQDTLRSSRELADLGATPLLLTLMALVHTTEGELPRSRSVLYYRAICHLLADTPQWRRQHPGVSVSASDLVPLAVRVGFEAHRRQEEVGASGFRGLTLAELESIVSNHLQLARQRRHDQYERVRRNVGSQLDRLIRGNGLLLDHGDGYFAFSHRSLQEFLAGLHFLNGSDYDLALDVATNDHWREPLILMAGYGAREGQALFFLVKLLSDIVARAASDPQNQGQDLYVLVGEMLSEIGRTPLIAKGHQRVLIGTGGTASESGLWPHVLDTLWEQASDTTCSPERRVRVMRVVGALGDPRFVSKDGDAVPVSHRAVLLPASRMTLGDETDYSLGVRGSSLKPHPLRTVAFGQYQIGAYPVTNAEYAEFVEDGGYDNAAWWRTRSGKGWLAGQRAFVEEMQQATIEALERDFGPELATYSREELRDRALRMALPRKEPFYWRNGRYNGPTQPVVGVNWWEAMAYCAWLSERLRTDDGERAVAYLPTEWEWERACRGMDDRREFPWGSDPPTPAHAHTRFNGLSLDYATPVGCFPIGTWPGGPLDMAGNVWEWTASRALPMEEEFDPVRETAEGTDEMVVRGGSWLTDVRDAIRCGYRQFDPPQNVYEDLGFRILLRKF